MKKLVVLLLLMLVLIGGNMMSNNSNVQLTNNFKTEANLNNDDDFKRVFDELGLPDIGEVSVNKDHIFIPKTSKNL